MRVLHERCCGLDIHKRFVVACLLMTSPDGAVHKEVRTYTTMTADVLAALPDVWRAWQNPKPRRPPILVDLEAPDLL